MLITDSLIFSRRGSSLFLALLLAASLLSACAEWLPDAHRPDLTQGNAIKPEDLAKLQPGMSKQKITSIIGSPTLLDPFHAERWDYVYRYIPGRGEIEQSRVSLFFDGDVLQRIDDSAYSPPIERDESGEIIDPPSPADIIPSLD
ncbi:MAG: outer membrane protein assembly factor BamE [Gammaproteobacteria bacterium]